MKLNKTILKEMIKDVLSEADKFTAGATGASGGEFRAGALDRSKEAAAGLTNAERGIMKSLIELLTAAAKETNIASGIAAQRIDQLAIVLQKVLKNDPDSATDTGAAGAAPGTQVNRRE